MKTNIFEYLQKPTAKTIQKLNTKCANNSPRLQVVLQARIYQMWIFTKIEFLSSSVQDTLSSTRHGILQNLFLITSKIWYMKLCITKLALDFLNNTYTLLFKPFYSWAARLLEVFNSFSIKIKIICIMYIRKRKKQ